MVGLAAVVGVTTVPFNCMGLLEVPRERDTASYLVKYRHIIVAIAHVATATHLRNPRCAPLAKIAFHSQREKKSQQEM